MIDTNFNRGLLYFGNLEVGEPIELASGNLYIDDIPISPYEEQTIPFHLNTNQSAKFECTINAIDLKLLNNIGNIPRSDKFTLTFDKQIMIQARWHKRHRINKKWIKRYGMKPDTIKVSCDAKTCDYDTHDGSFDIDVNSFKYNLKPHQKRRNLKIEW